MSVETPRTSKASKTPTEAANGVHAAAAAAESRLAEAAKRAEAAVRESVETLRAQTRAYADTAAERYETAHKLVVEHVRERPISSVLTAVGAGLVLGLLLGGRRR